MKRLIPLLATVSLMLTGCYATRIVTVAPDTRYQGTYSTTVTVPRTTPVTTTTRVTALSEDISLCLDLQAIGAAFAQSATVQDFENLLNNSSYMLSNLDLNQDGYVDYLRVIETIQGGAHVFVIQAVLAPDVYQDVATLVAEVSTVSTACHVQIIGSPYIYGPAYIIEPVFVVRPVIYTHLLRPYYKPWHSPWYWGYYPPCYRHPRPIYASHYHAYVNSYMRNHHYCHEFRYAPSCHYPAYEQVCRPVQRNDYGVSHPERSFSVRNADIPANDNFSPGQNRAANAREIRESVNASQAVTRSSTTRAASGSATTTSWNAAAAGNASRSVNSNTRSYGGSTGSTGTTATTGTTTRSAAGSSTRAGSTSGSSAGTQTTVKSNVHSSGSSNTRISTVSPNGTTSTTRRSSSASPSSSTRSSSPSTKSSYGSSSSSGSYSRSSGTSSRSSSSSSTRSSSPSTRSSGSAPRSSSSSPSSSSRNGSRR